MPSDTVTDRQTWTDKSDKLYSSSYVDKKNNDKF